MNANQLPQRTLSTFDVVCLISGTVIGAGIYKAPSIVAGQMGSGAEFLLVWLIGGLISVVGALCYAELATAYPNAGGEYHYLSKSFGKSLAFFYSWARSTVIITGSIAILSITLGDYMSTLISLGEYSSYIWAILAIVFLSMVNLLGIREGKWTQNVLTVVEVLGILAIVYAGFSKHEIASMQDLMARQSPTSNYGLAMVFVLLTFGGWNEAAYLSAEVKDEKRGVAKSLLWGLGLVTLLYLLANLAYFSSLGLSGMAKSNAVAYDVFTMAYGKESAMLFSAIVIFSCLNSLNATIIFGARSAFALGRDYSLFSWLGRWHASGNPRNSLIVQMLLAIGVVCVAIWTRQGFEAVVEFTAPVFWFFILLVGVAVIRLRSLQPEVVRPFKVPLYPLLPIIFIAVTGWMLWSSLLYTGKGALVGVLVLVLGLIPFFWEKYRLRQAQI